MLPNNKGCMRKFSLISLLLPLVSASALAQSAYKPGARVLSAEGGRYVFGQISDMRLDRFMLDTKTGRLWTIVVTRYKDSQGVERTSEEFLSPVVYRDAQSNVSNEPQPEARSK